MNDNYNIIHEYITGSSEKFEVAWEIHENFDKIKASLIEILFNKLELNFKSKLPNNFEIQNDKQFHIYKKTWNHKNQDIDTTTGLFSYCIESDISGLYFGIKRACLSSTIFSMKNIESKLSHEEAELVQSITSLNYKNSDWWLAYKNFDKFRYFTKDMFLQILKEPAVIVDYYSQNLLDVIEKTEKQIDEYCKFYKANYS